MICQRSKNSKRMVKDVAFNVLLFSVLFLRNLVTFPFLVLLSHRVELLVCISICIVHRFVLCFIWIKVLQTSFCFRFLERLLGVL